MDRVFKCMDLLLNYGYSIQFYIYTIQSWIEYSSYEQSIHSNLLIYYLIMDRVFEFMDTVSHYR